MRLFIGIKTGCEDYLASLQGELQKVGRGRFTHGENLHITLKFLGEQPPMKVSTISDAITEAGGGAFSLELGGARMFNRSGILSTDVAGETDKLIALAERLDIALEKRGFARESRPFRAHITLARDYQPFGDVSRVPYERRTFTVDEIILFESRRDGGRLVV